MRYTLEELEALPVNILRNVDIASPEEEALVQLVWNKKQLSLPVTVDLNITSSQTDNLTPEKEAELQKEIDEAKAAQLNKLTPTLEGDAENEKEIHEAFAPVHPLEVEPAIEPKAPKAEIKTRFCEFCDSKGVRHKKDCTRPK